MIAVINELRKVTSVVGVDSDIRSVDVVCDSRYIRRHLVYNKRINHIVRRLGTVPVIPVIIIPGKTYGNRVRIRFGSAQSESFCADYVGLHVSFGYITRTHPIVVGSFGFYFNTDSVKSVVIVLRIKADNIAEQIHPVFFSSVFRRPFIVVVLVDRKSRSGSVVVRHPLVDYKRLRPLHTHFLDCKRKQYVLSFVPRIILEIVVCKLNFKIICACVISLVY